MSSHVSPTQARSRRPGLAGARRCARAACGVDSASRQAWRAGCRASQLFTHRISGAANDRWVLRSRGSVGWTRRVGLQAAQERGHFVTSQRSERESRRPARRGVVQQEALGAGRGAERGCSWQLGGSCAARVDVDVQSAGAGAVRCGALRACEQRDVVAAAARVV